MSCIVTFCFQGFNGEFRAIPLITHFGKKEKGNGKNQLTVEDQIKQVILNFIQNSADSISGEGQITLTTEQQGSQLKIKIQDTGHGISEDDIENLFDPFLPLKPNRVRDWVFQSVMVSFGITGEI